VRLSSQVYPSSVCDHFSRESSIATDTDHSLRVA